MFDDDSHNTLSIGNYDEVATVSLANPSLPSIILPNSLPGHEHFQGLPFEEEEIRSSDDCFRGFPFFSCY